MDAQIMRKFEQKVANAFNNKEIRAPIHLHGKNEEELLNIFKDINDQDWVFSSWRSHYHCLLKGVKEEVLFNDILMGKSITLLYPENKIYTSAIVGGIIPIALGVALAIKRKSKDEHVYLFMGEMTAETGVAHEAHKYSVGFDLPITFIIEDNSKSVCTDTFETWGINKPTLKGLPKVKYYNYSLPWPHAGAGVRVQF